MEAKTISQIEAVGWAIPAEGVTLDDLIAELGKNVIEVDREHNRLKVIDVKVEV